MPSCGACPQRMRSMRQHMPTRDQGAQLSEVWVCLCACSAFRHMVNLSVGVRPHRDVCRHVWFAFACPLVGESLHRGPLKTASVLRDLYSRCLFAVWRGCGATCRFSMPRRVLAYLRSLLPLREDHNKEAFSALRRFAPVSGKVSQRGCSLRFRRELRVAHLGGAPRWCGIGRKRDTCARVREQPQVFRTKSAAFASASCARLLGQRSQIVSFRMRKTFGSDVCS